MIGLPEGRSDDLPLSYVATMAKNLESLGYGMSPALVDACRSLTLDELTGLYQEIISVLKHSKGAHRVHRPMYPGFPTQVMDMSHCELYINALFHYFTEGRYLPEVEQRERFPLLDTVELTILDLGSEAKFDSIFAQIVGSNGSLSEQDKQDVEWFVTSRGGAIVDLLPSQVPQKETMAFLAALLLKNTSMATDLISKYCKTATDVLRLAVAMSQGDVSLATSTKFRTFSRPERRLLLNLLERIKNPTEDMLRWKGRWIRLGERLHPREHAKKFPTIAEAFRVLREDMPFPTFNGAVEGLLASTKVQEAIQKLAARPGDLTRRLDHLLRLDPSAQLDVVAAFTQAADSVSTPVLLQIRHHFMTRHASRLRVFFPKGNLARAQAIPNDLAKLPPAVIQCVVKACEDTLRDRFAKLAPLGKCYLSSELSRYVLPFSQRSASKTLRTLARGSRIPLPDCKVLRFFVWWKNGVGRTDLDLSASMFGGKFEFKDLVSYYNLKSFGGHHSGDIVDAPHGASEFIDLTLSKVREQGVRFVVMTVNSYTQQPYADLPECFAGWMARQHPNSGEIFEPKTVQDKLDITADSRIAIPLIIDVQENQVIWADMSLKNHPRWNNNVHGNLPGISLSLQSLVEMSKPNVYDLLRLHIESRGQLVDSPDQAEAIYSPEEGIQYRHDELLSEFMA